MKTLKDFIHESVKENLDDYLINDLLLYAVNSRDFYNKFRRPMELSLMKKYKKGIELSVEQLAKSSVMSKHITEIIRSYNKEFDEDLNVSTSDRKELAKQLAEVYIENERRTHM